MDRVTKNNDLQTPGQDKAEDREPQEGPLLDEPLPTDVSDHVRRCMVGLGLNDWMVDTARYESIEVDNPGLTGRSQIRARYKVALIQLKARGGNHRLSVDHVITHEALHIALGPVYNALARIVELLPEHLQDHAYAIYEDAEEPAIESLAAALTPVLKAADPGGADWQYDEIDGVLLRKAVSRKIQRGT